MPNARCQRILWALLATSSVGVAEDSEQTLAQVPAHCAEVAKIRETANVTHAAARTLADVKAAIEQISAANTRLDKASRSFASALDNAERIIDRDKGRGQNVQQRLVAHAKYKAQLGSVDCATAELFNHVYQLEEQKKQLEAAEATAATRAKAADAARAKAAEPVAKSAPLAERKIPIYPDGRFAVGDPAATFQIAEPSRFVFVRRELRDPDFLTRPIPRGEAVLIVATSSGGLSIATVDGQVLEVKDLDLSTTPLPKAAAVPIKAEWLTVSVGDAWASYKDIETVYTAGAALYGPPKFLRLAPNDPRVDAFLQLREKTVACYDAAMAKLDPDGQRGKWDVVQGDRVESLNARYDRQVCSRCDCKGFNAKQRALAKALLAPLQKAELEKLQPVLTRVRGLFGGR